MSAYEPFPLSDASNALVRDVERLASRGRRFVALLLDGLLLFAVVIVAFLVALAAGMDDESDDFALLGYGVYALLLLFYYPLTLSRAGAHNGQTFGKQLMKVRVVTVEGEPVTFWRAARRDVLGTTVLGFLTFGLYSLIDCPWALPDARRQALHDKIASTYVYKAAVARDESWTEPPSSPFTSQPPAAQAPQHTWQPPVTAPKPPPDNDDMNRVFGR